MDMQFRSYDFFNKHFKKLLEFRNYDHENNQK